MKHVLKTQKHSLFFKTLIISVLTFLGVSCSKTTETIGNGLLSEADYIGVGYVDTLHIVCHSLQIDSMPTKKNTTVLLGSMMDPVMGLTDANFITQLHLSSTSHYFGDNPIIDSVVLQLAITGYYGDTTTMQTVHVYQIADTLSSTESYYQFSDIDVMPEDLANGYQFRPRPHTTNIPLGNDTLSQAVIRIPLANSLGEQFAATAAADTSIFGSTEAFKEYFYGLKIQCESVGQDGSIVYINPTSNTVTQLQVYYRETPDSNPMRYYFYITSEDVYFNQYLHDYTLGSNDFVQQVVDGDTLMGQQQLYLQSMGGVRVLLNFPDLTAWADSLYEEGTHLIINEAKLILPALDTDSDSSLFAPPASLALLSLNEDGTTSLLPDYLEGSNFYGGSYSSAKKSVTFRISEYLQGILLGNITSQGLYVSIVGASFNAQRWMMAGPEANQDKVMKCEIKYSIVGE